MEFRNRYKVLALELNAAVDRGLALNPDELDEHLKDGTFFEWLGEVPALDLSLYDSAEERASIVERFQRIHNASSGKFGVTNNGLCLLVAYCLEVVTDEEAG